MLSVLTKEEDELQAGWDSAKQEISAEEFLDTVRRIEVEIRSEEHITTCDRRNEARDVASELKEFIRLMQRAPKENAQSIKEAWALVRHLYNVIEQFEKVASETHCRICREVFRDRARSHLQASDGAREQLVEHQRQFHPEVL